MSCALGTRAIGSNLEMVLIENLIYQSPNVSSLNQLDFINLVSVTLGVKISFKCSHLLLF